MFSRMRQVFQKRPMLTNMATFGCMYVGAEMAQQKIIIHLDHEKNKTMDWTGVGRYAVVGVVGIAPALYVWYKILDRLLPWKSGKVVVAKVLCDQLISSTSCLVIFFVGMSFLEGKKDLFAELKAKFWTSYKLSCCFWLPAQTINFALLPPYTRVAFVGTASFIWVNVLCLIKRRQFSSQNTELRSIENEPKDTDS